MSFLNSHRIPIRAGLALSQIVASAVGSFLFLHFIIILSVFCLFVFRWRWHFNVLSLLKGAFFGGSLCVIQMTGL